MSTASIEFALGEGNALETIEIISFGPQSYRAISAKHRALLFVLTAVDRDNVRSDRIHENSHV